MQIILAKLTLYVTEKCRKPKISLFHFLANPIKVTKNAPNTQTFSIPYLLQAQLAIALLLHGPPMSTDKADFGLVLYNHANFYRFVETSSYWSVKRISIFLCFSSVNQRHISCIIVYNRTVTNTKNTVRAMHSCNSLLLAYHCGSATMCRQNGNCIDLNQTDSNGSGWAQFALFVQMICLKT